MTTHRAIAVLLGLAIGLATVVVMAITPRPVFTVRQVLVGLARQPASWAGRTVRVQGAALRIGGGCPSGQWCPSGLYEPDAARGRTVLWLEPGSPGIVLAGLRRTPIVGAVVPGPQHLRWHTPATYRVRFETVPHTSCDGRPCITAVLVDAAAS